MTPKLFTELGLSPELLKAIDKLGFEQAAPIQAEAIPLLLQGRDVVGQSQTGSGKTAAFAIPAIEKADPRQRTVQVLILCPTRELAIQVSEEIHKLALFKRGIHALPIYGGQSYERQFQGLKQGAQIVIGTPGRVMDHMRRTTLRLDSVKTVILDEVDVMLNMGFREDIEFILQAVPKERQTVFFSATIPRPIQELIQEHARDPQQVRIEQKAMTVPTVEQAYYEVDRRFKIELLTRLIDIHDLKLGIIFCNTKRMVDDLVEQLNAQGYSADRLHGDMNQAQRDRVMNKFRKSGLEFLVATDVAARGIDVDDVQVVFNYDLPYDGEDYVHRIGRTGRAGRAGRAVTFVSGRELFQIQQIERYTRTKIHRLNVPTLDEVEEARTSVFLEKLRATLQSGGFKKQDHLIERLLEEGFTSTDIASALIHQLQSGDAAAAARTTREAEYARPEGMTSHAARRDRDEPRPDRRIRSAGRPGDRREERGSAGKFPADQPSGPQRQPWVSRQGTVPRPASQSAREPGSAPRKSDPSAVAKAEHPTVEAAHKTRERPVRSTVHRERVEPPSTRPPKHSRRTPDKQARLYMNIGTEMGIAPSDIVGAILGETGLPAEVVGTVDLRERHLFVDVASEHTNSIVSKLNRAGVKGRKVKVKLA